MSPVDFMRTKYRVRVLEMMLASLDDEVFAGQVAAKLEMPSPTAGKILSDLYQVGWLVRTPEKRKPGVTGKRALRIYYRLNKRRLKQVRDYVQG